MASLRYRRREIARALGRSTFKGDRSPVRESPGHLTCPQTNVSHPFSFTRKLETALAGQHQGYGGLPELMKRHLRSHRFHIPTVHRPLHHLRVVCAMLSSHEEIKRQLS